MAVLSDLIRPSFMLFTIVFYCLLIYVLFKCRKSVFKSSFYLLFISTGIADVQDLLLRVFMMTTSLFFADEWLSLSHKLPLATVQSALAWYINYVQIIGLVALSINRFSAVVLPIWYNKFWTHEKVKFIPLAQWILPLLWALPMIGPCCQSIYYDNDTTNMGFVSDEVNNIYSIIDLIIEALICVPLIIFLNVMIVAISLRNRRQISNGDSELISARKKAEMRLAVVGIIISVSYVSSVVFDALYDFSSSNLLPLNSDEMSDLFYDCFDTFTLSNPYILLILSQATRNSFFRFIMCKKVVSEVTD